MNTVVIVDDEPLVTDTLKTLVNWESHDMRVLDVANDGLSAERIILEGKPDLVITDIRMPGLSGLELIGRVQKKLPGTKFVIISGYNDFNYIRAALRLNIVDYLDKPVTCEKIDELLLEIHPLLAGKEKDVDAGSVGAGFRDRIGFLLQTGEWKDAQQTCREMVDEIARLHPNIDIVKHICLEIVYHSLAICSETGLDYTLDGQRFLPHVEIAAMSSLDDVSEWTLETLGKIIDWLRRRRESFGHKDIVKAKRFIDEHYNEAITLRMLADMCYMNPNYFSAVFRDHVGMSYSKYLNTVRMEHAKKMIKNGIKVKDVSSKCGFQSSRYFSEKFKLYTGVTPEQYRLDGGSE